MDCWFEAVAAYSRAHEREHRHRSCDDRSPPGYQVKVVMPESVSAERVQLLQGFGAEIIFSAAEKGTTNR